MTPEHFVAAIRVAALESAVRGEQKVLEDPPGRRPAEGLLRRSNWYRALPVTDQAMVLEVARSAAHAAVFNFLAILDGVQSIEAQGPKGELRLTYVSPQGEEQLLNIEGEHLHDLLNDVAPPI